MGLTFIHSPKSIPRSATHDLVDGSVQCNPILDVLMAASIGSTSGDSNVFPHPKTYDQPRTQLQFREWRRTPQMSGARDRHDHVYVNDGRYAR